MGFEGIFFFKSWNILLIIKMIGIWLRIYLFLYFLCCLLYMFKVIEYILGL